jgi:hypothetical protein
MVLLAGFEPATPALRITKIGFVPYCTELDEFG